MHSGLITTEQDEGVNAARRTERSSGNVVIGGRWADAAGIAGGCSLRIRRFGKSERIEETVLDMADMDGYVALDRRGRTRMSQTEQGAQCTERTPLSAHKGSIRKSPIWGKLGGSKICRFWPIWGGTPWRSRQFGQVGGSSGSNLMILRYFSILFYFILFYFILFYFTKNPTPP